MKNFASYFLLTFLFASFVALVPANVAAQTKGSDVKIEVEGDTLYLTTETSEDSQNEESTASATREGLVRVNKESIFPPTGFASDIGQLINAILSGVIMVAVLLVFFYLIWGAMNWITSGGDTSKTGQARDKITAAIIGLIIMASSYAVLTLVLRFLGFMDLNEALSNLQTLS